MLKYEQDYFDAALAKHGVSIASDDYDYSVMDGDTYLDGWQLDATHRQPNSFEDLRDAYLYAFLHIATRKEG